MIILGIDPGTAIVGWGVIKTTKKNCQAVDFGVIRTETGLPTWERLEIISQEINKIIKKNQPDQIVVESLFYFKNQKTVMTVSQARGVILLAAQIFGAQIYELTPLQIKHTLTGYGRAEKKELQETVKTILGLTKIPKPDDAADALAAAICSAQLAGGGASGSPEPTCTSGAIAR